MGKEIVSTKRAPRPTSPLSQGTKVGNLVFVSGITGRDPQTGQMGKDIESQTRQTLENIKAILEAAGTSMANVAKTLCFLKEVNDRPAFNKTYEQYFPTNPPARTCVQAGALGPGVLVEVEAVACMPD